VATEGCLIDVTDLADIFIVGRSKKAKNNLKVSAQTDESFSRYNHCRYGGYRVYLECFMGQCFSENFYFLKNDKSQEKDFVGLTYLTKENSESKF
jgi:hypothetical protein